MDLISLKLIRDQVMTHHHLPSRDEFVEVRLEKREKYTIKANKDQLLRRFN